MLMSARDPFRALAIALVLCSSATAQLIQSTGGGGLWSSAATWQRISPSGGSALPTTGDTVVITQGNPVTLNTNSNIQNLAHLRIEDVLTVQAGGAYQLGVSRIDVGIPKQQLTTAAFHIGSVATPFANRFTLTLTDAYLSSSWSTNVDPPYENKTFAVHAGATLELHGKTTNAAAPGGGYLPIPSWIRLADGHSFEAGTNSLVLESNPTGWTNGSRIVVASTDFDEYQAEEFNIASISGATVNTTTTAAWDHHGEIESGLVDERAEVALLSRNILIQGDANSASTYRGGNMSFFNQDGTLAAPTVHISGVELKSMGWRGAPGRYPLHFHKLGNTSGCYVTSSSIHNCLNRAVAIHATNGVLLQDLVAYDSWGHLFYFEEGEEVDNTLRRNLGLVNRLPAHPDSESELGDPWSGTGGQPYFVESDNEPSVYWVTNTDNTIEDNVAAGSVAHGFWYDLDPYEPFFEPVRFSGNSSHSNGINGFHQEKARMITVDPSQPTFVEQLDATAVFEDFTSWKNRKAGVWIRSYGTGRWLGARIADSRLGIYFASEGHQKDYPSWSVEDVPPFDVEPFISDPFNEGVYEFSLSGAPGFSFQTLEDSVVIGESGNLGNPTQTYELSWPPGARSLPVPTDPQLMIKGIEAYDGAFRIEGTEFINYEDVALPYTISAPGGDFDYRVSAAISSRGHHDQDADNSSHPGNFFLQDPRNCIQSSTFTNVDHAVLFPIPHQPHWEVVWEDPLNVLPDFWDGVGPMGVVGAMIFDIDGCIPGSSPNTYVVNNTPLLRPLGYATPTPLSLAVHYAEPLFVPGPGSRDGNYTYGQLEFDILQPTWALPYIELNPIHRPGQADKVFTPGLSVIDPQNPSAGDISTIFPVTLLLEDPDDTASPGVERYRINYPTASPVSHLPSDDPRNLEIRFQFSEPGRAIMLDIPYDGGGGAPTLVQFGSRLFPGIKTTMTAAADVAHLEAGNGTKYYYDSTNKRLWLKPTLNDLGGSAFHSIYDGREVTYYVDG